MGIDSMKITITLLPENTTQQLTIQKGTPIIDILKKIHLKPDGLIILRNNTPIPIDENLVHEESLSILKVASGG